MGLLNSQHSSLQSPKALARGRKHGRSQSFFLDLFCYFFASRQKSREKSPLRGRGKCQGKKVGRKALWVWWFYRSKTIRIFSFSLTICSFVSLPTLLINRRLSIARTWSINTSEGWSSWPFRRWIRNSSISLTTLLVIGHTNVDGWNSFRRSVWMITTGRVFPGSVPILGLRSANQMSYWLCFIQQLFKLL